MRVGFSGSSRASSAIRIEGKEMTRQIKGVSYGSVSCPCFFMLLFPFSPYFEVAVDKRRLCVIMSRRAMSAADISKMSFFCDERIHRIAGWRWAIATEDIHADF